MRVGRRGTSYASAPYGRHRSGRHRERSSDVQDVEFALEVERGRSGNGKVFILLDDESVGRRQRGRSRGNRKAAVRTVTEKVFGHLWT